MKKIITSILALFLLGAVYSQSADVVTDIINTPEVTFGQVCYLSAIQQGFVSDNATYEQAIKALFENGQIPQEDDKNSVVVMGNLTFIYAKMWNIQGGLMYRLTKGSPRYAFKQMKVDGVISETADPNQVVSGLEALNIYTSCAIQYGGMELNTRDE